ncbi:hypothetical protein LCGC14_2516580 [marine sediment metagenome]|uniref:Uncharacterized protein n=1 Tax=marine sediment metagenome TaxID=412755 RepID=A0A0F9AY68_9ZZZZ
MAGCSSWIGTLYLSALEAAARIPKTNTRISIMAAGIVVRIDFNIELA